MARAIAQAEEKWGCSPEEVHRLAEQFYDLMAGTENAFQYSACHVLPIPASIARTVSYRRPNQYLAHLFRSTEGT